MKLYPITVRGQKAGLFQNEIPDKKIVVRLQYIVIRNPHDSKPRKIGEVEQRESNYCLYMISAPDIHQALHEISLDTGIKFYFHVCKGSETYSWVVYCIDYPPHLSLENIPKTLNKKED